MSRRETGPDETGAVAAEFAVTLPAALLVIVLGVGALAAGALAVRLQDAAADAARVLARGDPVDDARAIAATAASSVSIAVTRRDDLVCVELAGPVRIGGLPAFGLEVSASSCALDGGL